MFRNPSMFSHMRVGWFVNICIYVYDLHQTKYILAYVLLTMDYVVLYNLCLMSLSLAQVLEPLPNGNSLSRTPPLMSGNQSILNVNFHIGLFVNGRIFPVWRCRFSSEAK